MSKDFRILSGGYSPFFALKDSLVFIIQKDGKMIST